MANRERLTSTLMDLIRIDSPTGEEDEIDRAVTTRLRALGCRVEHDSFGNLIANAAAPENRCFCRPTWTRWSRAGASDRSWRATSCAPTAAPS